LWQRSDRLGRVLWRLSLEVLGQVHRAAPRSHLTPLLALGLLLVPLGALTAGRLGGTRWASVPGALAGGALAAAVSLTVFRDSPQVWHLAGLRTCAVTAPNLLTGDGVSNLVLFAPAAFLAVLAIGRPGLVTAGVVTISLTVEATQAIHAVGVCDSSDALLNSLGGLVAALLASLARWDPAPPASVSGSGSCRRSC
jgi:hypothetical protein